MRWTLCVGYVHDSYAPTHKPVHIKIMITKIRQIQLKIQKFNEQMVKLKTKYLHKPDVYADLHKLDLRIEEVEKLIENDKS